MSGNDWWNRKQATERPTGPTCRPGWFEDFHRRYCIPAFVVGKELPPIHPITRQLRGLQGGGKTVSKTLSACGVACVAGKADDGSKRIKLHCQSFGEARQRFLVALCFVYRPWLDILMIESCTSCEMEPLFGRTLWIWILEWIGFCDLFQKMWCDPVCMTGAEELGTPPKLSLGPTDKVFGDEGTWSQFPLSVLDEKTDTKSRYKEDFVSLDPDFFFQQMSKKIGTIGWPHPKYVVSVNQWICWSTGPTKFQRVAKEGECDNSVPFTFTYGRGN